MTREMQLLVDEAGWTLDDLRWATINAMKSAFLPFDERLEIIEHVVKPGYAALGAATDPSRARRSVSGGRERVGRDHPGAQLLLAPQPLEVAAPALGHDGGEHHLGVVATGRRRADVRQRRLQQLDAQGVP